MEVDILKFPDDIRPVTQEITEIGYFTYCEIEYFDNNQEASIFVSYIDQDGIRRVVEIPTSHRYLVVSNGTSVSVFATEEVTGLIGIYLV